MPRTKIKFVCKHCGGDGAATPSDIRRGGGMFCSVPCYLAHAKENVDPLRLKKWRVAYYQKNKERIRAQDQARKDANPEEYKRKNREKSARYLAAHPEKRKSIHNKYTTAHPTYFRPGHYRRKYGVTLEFVQSEIAAQDNRCKICRDEFTDTPHVDHDHDTGKYRSMLDFRCNRGLGSYKDDPARIFSALLYLVGHKDIPTIS
jgi:hypothetical protein